MSDVCSELIKESIGMVDVMACRKRVLAAALSMAAAGALVTLASACGGEDSGAGPAAPGGGTGGSDAGTGAQTGSGGAGGATDAGSDTGVDAGPSYSSCSTDGWCWALPDPQGNDLLAAFAISPSDVWVVGLHGTVLHHDGQRWGNAPVPTTAALRGVWASGPSDVWAVGDDGVVLRFDGQRWSTPELLLGADGGALATDLTSVSGTGPDDVWIVGAGGRIVHWDGASFSNPASGTTRKLNAVWAAGTADVWAVGDGGAIVRFDGAEWAAENSGSTAALHTVHGTSTGDVWAAGATILHYDGTRWSDARADIQTTTLWEVVAEAEDSVWVFGDGGGVWHREADTWQKRSSGTENSLRGVARLDTGKLLSVGTLGALIFWDGAGRTLLTRGSARNRLAISGNSPTNVWAVGDEIVRFDGTKWFDATPETSRALFSVHAASATETWAVGTGGSILRWDARSPSATTVPSGTSVWLRSIWTDGSGNGWIAGVQGNLFQLAGGAVEKQTSGTSNDLADVWAAGPSAAWAVGARGTIVEYDGAAWTAVTPAPATASLRAVWGSAANDVWAVGTEGTILHFDGSEWSLAADGEVHSLNDVWGSAANDVYAVGTGGTILHYDGSAWSPQDSGTGIALNGVWGSSGNDVWAVGESGTILRRLR